MLFRCPQSKGCDEVIQPTRAIQRLLVVMRGVYPQSSDGLSLGKKLSGCCLQLAEVGPDVSDIYEDNFHDESTESLLVPADRVLYFCVTAIVQLLC